MLSPGESKPASDGRFKSSHELANQNQPLSRQTLLKFGGKKGKEKGKGVTGKGSEPNGA